MTVPVGSSKMGYKGHVYLFLVLYTLLETQCHCAVQHGAPEIRHAFLPDRLYSYKYQSVASVYQGVELTVHSKVSLGLVQSTSTHTELFIEFRDTTLSLATPNSQPAEPFSDLSHWFSFTLDQNGRLSEVFYPLGESVKVLAFKKTVVKMLSVGTAERTIEGSEVRLSENYLENGLTKTKVLTFNENGLLRSGKISECMLHDHTVDTPLLGHPISSNSSLVFTGENEVDPTRSRPDDLISDSFEIGRLLNHVPLSQLQPTITGTLTECASNKEDSCLLSLSSLFQRLSSEDTRTFLEDFFESRSSLSDFTERALVLINIVSQLEMSRESSKVSAVLTEHVLQSTTVDTPLIVSVLRLLTQGKLVPDRATVDAVNALLSSGDPQLTQPALLALGGTSQSLQAANTELANEIVDTLHTLLEHFSGERVDSSSRLRRSIPLASYDTITHATVIDGIGNARSERSLQILSDHVTRSHDSVDESHDLTIRHAAINALRGLESEESAETLLAITDSTPHPSVRHLAASIYQVHSRRTRDLSHITEETHPHRSRRQVESSVGHVTNVTMPTVTWSRQFGETNISVDVTRTLRNSFDIETAPLSSHYTFSLHDETSFTADLLLSDGRQRPEMLRTELCLQGTATYDANILTDVSYNLTAHQFDRLSSTIPAIEASFDDAYAQVAGVPSLYSGLDDLVQSSLSNLPSRFSSVDDLLASFRRVVDGIDGEFVLKSRAEELFLSLNQTFFERRGLAIDAVQSISSAVTSLLPSLPEALSSSLLIESQPFIDSTFYVPYIRYAPQQALSNINVVVRRTESAFASLESSILTLLNLTGEFGANRAWLSPAPQSLETKLALLISELEVAVDTAEKCEGQTYDGATLSELLTLRATVTRHLYTALSSLGSAGAEVTDASSQINSAYQQSRDTLVALRLAFDQARAEVDAIFGPKFHPNFPRRVMHSYPSTNEGLYNGGVTLLVPSEGVVMPFSSYVHRLEPDLLPVDLRPLYSGHNSSTLFVPAESALRDIRLIIPNLIPPLQVSGEFVQSGETLNTFTLLGNGDHVHVEAFKVVDGVWFRIDSTQFVQPALDTRASVNFDCNHVVVYVGGVVMMRRSLLESTTVITEVIGDPLVENIPGHEFPRPFDLVVRGGDVITSSVEGTNITDVMFFQSVTMVMVGPIPVQFEFSSVGSYEFSYSPSINLLSKTLSLSTTPTIHAKARGSMKVVSTVTADVEFSGTVLQASLPLTINQDFSVWPQTASSTMGVVLVPSTLTLTSQLFPRSATGDPVDPLQTNTLWRYSLPAFNRSEFGYTGSLADTTPLQFTPLVYSSDQSDCFVRQSLGRSYDNPAFELEFSVADPDSILATTYNVGTAINSGDVIKKTVIAGSRIVVPSQLVSGTELYFSVSAENLNGIETIASCQLPHGTVFDRSPPLARVVPIRSVSSHPSKIRVLVTLFDEAGFDGEQEVAIGRVPGVGGDSVMVWSGWNASLIYTPPEVTGDVLDYFSFGRSGRLTNDVITVMSSVENLTICASSCYNNSECISFDYSRQESRCIFHSGIEGPSLPQNTLSLHPYQNAEVTTRMFESVYSTPELRRAGRYYHYEKLGMGNSAEFEFSDLAFEDNTMYYVNVRIVNRLGVENVVSSTGFLVDLTPPHPGMIRNATNDMVVSDGCGVSEVIPGCVDDSGVPNHRVIVDGPGSAVVFNGPSPAVDAMYTSTNGYITAHWNGFQDAESGIFAFTWCIGTSIGSCDILPPTDPHAALGLTTPESWTNTGLASFANLSDGSYFITVQAISNVDYGGPLATTVQHSTPYVIDTTPPIVEEVFNIQYNYTTNELTLEYNVTDKQSGIESVEIAIGRTQRDTRLLGWTELELGGRGSVAVVIPDGVPGWVKLRATNKAGLRSIAVAENSVMVDRTPPLVETVNDGAEISLDASFQLSLSMLCVNWEGVVDPESGVVEIEWNISMTSNSGPGISSSVLTPTEIASRVACRSGLSLNHNTTYYSFLTVTNGAMTPLSITVGSNGVRTDNTPPSTGSVSDGLDASSDQQFSSSQTTLSATWAGVLDYESGIESYRVTVYQTPSGGSVESLVYEESVPEYINTVSWSYFSFSNGDFIRVEVEGFNGAGMSSTQSSDGVTIDFTPPELRYIVDGANPPIDRSFQSSSDSFQVSWDITDNQSGISQIEGTIFEVEESRRIQIYPDPQVDASEQIPMSDTIWTVTGLQLNSGSRYIASISITNEADLRAVFESNGVTVDLTPPIVEYVSIVSDTYSETASTVTMISNRVNVKWSGFDPESGIESYLVGIVNENSTFVTHNITFGGSSVGGSVENFGLIPGDEEYRVAVIAVNNVEMSSSSVYSSPFTVVSGDSAGVVVDGDAPDQTDIDYTDEVTTVTMKFYGFNSRTCGGIARYEWAVGTSDEGGVAKESIMEFTTEGIVTSDDSSGYAQRPLPNLSSLSGKRLFITVRGITDCGEILESTSDGFVIVTTPPTLRIIRPDTLDSGDSLYQSTSGFSIRWNIDEDIADSEIPKRVFVKLGSYPGGDDVSDNVEVSENYFNGDNLPTDGSPVFVTVTAVNEAGLESVAVSDAIVRDTSPPVIEVASNFIQYYPVPARRLLVDLSKPITGILSVEFSQLEDPESEIREVTISAGTDPNDQSVLSPTVFSLRENSVSFQTPVVFFNSSSTTVKVTAINSAGLESVWWVSIPSGRAALSLEVMGVVDVHSNTNNTGGGEFAKCLCDTDVVTLSVELFGTNSCERYQLGISTQMGFNDEVYSFQTVPQLSSSMDLSRINFQDHLQGPVYFNFRCFNRRQQSVVISSAPIFIKACPSSDNAITVLDGAQSGVDVDCSQSLNQVYGQVNVDINCPVKSFSWDIERIDGDTITRLASMDIESHGEDTVTFNNSLSLFTDLPQDNALSVDQCYRLTVHAFDYCDRLFTGTSDGFCICKEVVTPGLVRDGYIEGHDAVYQNSTSQLAARWSGFGEVMSYQVAAGSDLRFPSTRTDIVPFTDIGLNTTITFQNLDLVSMSTYYITVRAFAESGEFVDVTSNGVTVGFEQAIVRGNVTLNEYQSDTSTISLYWSDFVSDVPIRLYEVAIGTTQFSRNDLDLFCEDIESDFAGEFSLFGFSSVALDTSATFSRLSLTHNTTYYPILRVLDQAGKCVAVTTESGVTVDTTDPLIETRPDFVRVRTEQSRSSPAIAVYVGEFETIQVSWDSFYDEESAISAYEVAIFSQSVCGDPDSVMEPVVDFRSINDDLMETSFEGVALEVGVVYVGVVRGRNGAGLTSRAYSLPFVVDPLQYFSGDVKDGSEWESDVIFQSDLSMLSATFAHSKLPPPTPSAAMSGPCPNTLFYGLSSLDSNWTAVNTRALVHPFSTGLVYETSQVGVSTNGIPGITITSERRDSPGMVELLTGGYRTGVSLSSGGTISMDIFAAQGEFTMNAVTSVLVVEGLNTTIAVFEPEFEVNFPDSANFRAFGLQIYQSNSSTDVPQRAVLWARSGGVTVNTSHDLSHIDLSQIHTFSMEFNYERDDLGQSNYATLYIDGILETSLYDIPVFSDNAQVVLHVFGRMGYVPPPPPGTQTVQAVFGNISLPMRVGEVCDYGDPFFSRGSPVVELRAAVGSTPGDHDVVDYKTVALPCVTCLPTSPCPLFGCDPNCTLEDPYIFPVVFSNLTLSPGNSPQERNQTDSSVDPSVRNTLSSLLIGQFQPAVYFVTIEAITASGSRFYGTSNGVTMDISPPNLVSEIEQFDVTFSLQESSRFQGNNHTIASRWLFDDLQSGVVEYEWAIGTTPYGQDVQQFESVGTATSAVNSNLTGVIRENVTYYVTVAATNGAGLKSNATSQGIIYSTAELNSTALALFIAFDHTDLALRIPEGPVLRIPEGDRVGVSWGGVGDDVEEVYWSIGSERLGPRVDVFPRTLVSFNDSQSAALRDGVLLLDGQSFASISEVVAVAEGKEVDPRDNGFNLEPGRLVYQSLEFCNFVHRCTIVDTGPSVLIRDKDERVTTNMLGERVEVTVTQEAIRPLSSDLDRRYTYTLATSGLDSDSLLVTGFLSHSDVTQNYPVGTSYISDPAFTMAQTSREIARRFTQVGGPSFFISFLGQESLSDVVEVNVTFHGGLDWSAATPELAYWDIDDQVWREVAATCGTGSNVHWPTFTISAQICSTLITTNTNRPASLSRRRRQASGMGSGMGNGMDSDPTSEPLTFLDRPTQFMVISVGNTSTNTRPSLLLPTDPLVVMEGSQLRYQLEYEDSEEDTVSFYLASIPELGSATLTTEGLLTYTPCDNCIGLEMIEITIVENPFLETQVALSALGQLYIQIDNVDGSPQVYFYTNVSSDELTVNSTISVYMDANRTSPAIIASVAAFDFDGYNDDLSLITTNGQHGVTGSEIWLDVVNVPESLPLSFANATTNSVTSFSGYVTFVGAYITYLPRDPNFVGVDTITVHVQDNGFTYNPSNFFTINIEVLPSLCENNGVCGGSEADPACTNIELRRSGFEGYNCSCPSGFGGQFCEIQTSTPAPEPARDCPVGVPMVHCDGDPCEGALCPSHPDAVCTPNYCGACTAQWTLPDGTAVTCHADIVSLCDNADIPNGVFPPDCVSTVCECPFSQYECPEDSIITVTRVSGCCVSYQCVCPNISCPFLMEGGLGVQPVTRYRGNQFPGRCCPSYRYLDIDECLDDSQHMCTDVCTNEENSYSCSCPSGKTLAQNGVTCGVCPYNGMEYLAGDRVKIGCNWCVCRGDDLSGERWHCTAAPCERGCFSDGRFFPVGTPITQGGLTCVCEATDKAAEWTCPNIA